MLQSLRLLVHPIPLKAERLDEICLDNAVTTQSAERCAASALGERRAVIELVGEQSLIREAAHHAANRRGSQIESLRDVVGRGSTRSATDRIDRHEVVLNRRR